MLLIICSLKIYLCINNIKTIYQCIYTIKQYTWLLKPWNSSYPQVVRKQAVFCYINAVTFGP